MNLVPCGTACQEFCAPWCCRLLPPTAELNLAGLLHSKWHLASASPSAVSMPSKLSPLSIAVWRFDFLPHMGRSGGGQLLPPVNSLCRLALLTLR